MRRKPWTDQENDLIVADYFAMLQEEIAGRTYNKTERNRKLQQQIDRNKGSIEFKHQNISTILQGLGEIWIKGYKPKENIQKSLVDAVARWLADNPDWLEREPELSDEWDETSLIPFITPPTLSNQPPPKELERMQHLVRKLNWAERDERNRKLGRAGEKRALAHERERLKRAGRDDLAQQIRWVSEEDGDGAGYDIASFSPEGESRLIEVKTTNGWERTPFHITGNELRVANERKNEWCLMRIWSFSREPKAFELRPPLERHVSLTPTSFLASIR